MKVVLIWWITCLIWSSVWLFIKLGVRDLPPFTFAGLRLIAAVAVLVPFILIRRIPLPRGWRDWRLIIVTGLILFGLNYGLIFWGAQHISSGLVAVLQAATPAFSLLFGGFFHPEERFTFAKFAAIALGIAGVAIIFSDQLRLMGVQALFGSLAVAAAAMFVAIAYLIVKTGIEVKPSVLMAGQMFFGAVPLLILGFLKEGNPLELRWSTAAVVSLLYLVFAGSIVAFWLNYWLLKRMTATKLLSMGLVEPLIAVLLGAIVLDERLAAVTAIGGLCVMISIVFILREKRAVSGER
jgi:drug/metabolite transporter (DMT)-like permease